MKQQSKTPRIAFVATACLAFGLILGNQPLSSFASGGPGGGNGGGGGIQVVSFSGNWIGSITTPFGTGAFTMGISQSTSTVGGSVHFGAPIFDATRRLAGVLVSSAQFSGTVSNGQGSIPITGTLSPDGRTITGTVAQLNQVYTYVVTRQ